QMEAARKLAADAFVPTGKVFLKEATDSIAGENAELDKWLAERVAEMSPAVVASQPELFGTTAKTKTVPAPKPAPLTPAERLAAIHADGNQSPRLRSHADALLKLYQQRHDR